MLKCFNAISYFILACVISLLVLYLLTLVRVIRGARYRFLIYVIVMLMISNLGSVATIFATSYYCKTEFKSNTWNVLKWLTGSIQNGFYFVAHWILASKYNQIASAMPFLLKNENIPAS